jgi:hypothetical protein
MVSGHIEMSNKYREEEHLLPALCSVVNTNALSNVLKGTQIELHP